jgi:zinc transport system substrate-binding protein
MFVLSNIYYNHHLNPMDLKTLDSADILVMNGAGMETFLDKVLQRFPSLPIIDASENSELLKEKGEPNPHVWVSVTGAIQQLDNITSRLCDIDPSHANQFVRNAKEYRSQLESLRDKMHQELKGIKTKEVITFHEAFPYFAREFHFTIAEVIEHEPGSEPSPKEMIRLIQKIKKMPAKILFVEPQYSNKTAEILAHETGASLFVLDPVVNGDGSLDSYVKAMEHNLVVLRKALF